MTIATVWRVPRESDEFVGPITLTATVDGAVVPISSDAVQFAVIPDRARPAEADWADPVGEPGGVGIGVTAAPVSTSIRYGIWAKITDNPFAPVLGPEQVGWIDRT